MARSKADSAEALALRSLQEYLKKAGVLGCMFGDLNTLRAAVGLPAIDRQGYLVPTREEATGGAIRCRR